MLRGIHDNALGCGAVTLAGFGRWESGGRSPTKKEVEKFLDQPMQITGCYIGAYLKDGKITLRQWRDDPYRVLTIAVTAPRMNGEGIDEAMKLMGWEKMINCQNPYRTHPFDGDKGVTLWVMPGLSLEEHEKAMKKLPPKQRRTEKEAADW